jgi:hypothetical protein
VRELGTDVVKLILAYARQETIDPLKTLGRYVLWGIIGALQTELASHLSGSLTWVPYVGGLLFAVLVAGVAVTRISKASR